MPHRMIINLAKYLKAKFLIETQRLELEGIQPNANTAPGTSNRLRVIHQC